MIYIAYARRDPSSPWLYSLRIRPGNSDQSIFTIVDAQAVAAIDDMGVGAGRRVSYCPVSEEKGIEYLVLGILGKAVMEHNSCDGRDQPPDGYGSTMEA